MRLVKDLEVHISPGTTNKLTASWLFNTGGSTTKTTTTSKEIKPGSIVKIKSSATKWYTGQQIPDWVKSLRWNVHSIGPDNLPGRVVLNTSPDRAGEAIMSPINVNDLEGVSATISTTTTTGSFYDPNTVARYRYQWFYDLGDRKWLYGDGGTTEHAVIQYTIPEGAKLIHLHVLPESKTKKIKQGDKEVDVPYWTSEVSMVAFLPETTPPKKAATPSVSSSKSTLNAIIQNIDDEKADCVEYEVYDRPYDTVLDMRWTFRNRVTAPVLNTEAGCVYTMRPNTINRVRARYINYVGGSASVTGEWSSFSSEVVSPPSAPPPIKSLKALNSSSIQIVFGESAKSNITSWVVRYGSDLTSKDDLINRSSDEVKEVTIENFPQYTFTGLGTGKEYTFVYAYKNSAGVSDFSKPKSVLLGKKPSAPTIWSNTTTAIVGEKVNLYWRHNAKDNSSETYAQVEIVVNGNRETKTIENKDLADEDKRDLVKSLSLNTSSYQNGAKIVWRVRTMGVTKEYGEWSASKQIDVYSRPTIDLILSDTSGKPVTTLNSLPLRISGKPGPNSQTPISYNVIVTSKNDYTTLDSNGENKYIFAGTTIYDKTVVTSNNLLLDLMPNSIDLEPNASYNVTVVVAMNSGLTATATKSFDVKWKDQRYTLDASITIDTNGYSASIVPYCLVDSNQRYNDVTLSVYRRNYDGSFTTIEDNIPANKTLVALDPHPSLDFARYRISARSNTTGAVSFYDPPDIPVGCTSIIFQWDETWNSYAGSMDVPTPTKNWTGSLLELKYNVDIADSFEIDSSLVNYVGRTHPVSYYGTAISTSSSWNTEIPAYDSETLALIRRLAVWRGDVYVREPNGTGYWANVSVSYNVNHAELVIPIEFTIRRVEGGM